ncbi:MAG TPA: Mur ligase family protein, partial [Bacteroidota bacterium]
RLTQSHDVAVIEVGTNHPGEIGSLCEVLLPTHGLITNIGHEHLEFFKDLNGVARAEAELFDWLKTYRSKDGKIFLNKDDAHLKRQSRSLRNIVSYGFTSRNAAFRGTSLKLSDNACAEFQVSTPGGRSALPIALSIPGLHSAHNALAAAAVGMTLRVPGKNISEALHAFRPAGKRMELLTVGGITVLNDTYNSNPDSALAALRTLSAMKTAGKRIAVLADMLELGPHADPMHTRIGRVASAANIDYLLTYGPLSRATYEAATTKFKAHYDQKNMLSEYLSELLSRGDVVLVKGSRGMKMEDVVTFLKERFAKAA